MSIPTLSIAIPTFNRAGLLRETLHDLAGFQGRLDMEVVVADNASTDETAAVVSECQAMFRRLRYIRQPENLGHAANLNTALQHSEGQFLYSLCDDDRLFPDGVAAAVAVLQQRANVVAVFGGHQEWSVAEQKAIGTRVHTDVPRFYGQGQALEVVQRYGELWLPVARRDLVHRFGGYDLHSFSFVQQLHMWLRHGEVAVLPHLFYRHSHTVPRLEYELTEPWYHDFYRADYELFAGRLLDEGADPDALISLITSSSAHLYRQGARFANAKHDVLRERQFLLRSKVYGVWEPQMLLEWERRNLLKAAMAMLLTTPGLRQASRVVLEEAIWADAAKAHLQAMRPALDVRVLPRTALVRFADDGETFILAEQFDTLSERREHTQATAVRQRAFRDLVSALRLTNLTLELDVSVPRPA